MKKTRHDYNVPCRPKGYCEIGEGLKDPFVIDDSDYGRKEKKSYGPSGYWGI